MAKKASEEKFPIVINSPKFSTVRVRIIGISPYVQNKMSKENLEALLDVFLNGKRAKTVKETKGKDIQKMCDSVTHFDSKNKPGIPVTGLKSALIRAAGLSDMEMKATKLSLDVLPSTFDKEDGMPLILIRGKPRPHIAYITNGMGKAAISIRPMWEKWAAEFDLSFDSEMFSPSHILNLVQKAGLQVGIGSGRKDSGGSKASPGWGSFRLATTQEDKQWQRLKL